MPNDFALNVNPKGQAWRLKKAYRCELCKALQGLEFKLKSSITGLKTSFVLTTVNI